MSKFPEMVRTKPGHLLILLSMTLALAGFTSCVFDNDTPHIPGDGKDMVLTLSVPNISSGITRSQDNDQEILISRIDVLAFKSDNGTETFMYRTYGAEMEEGASNEKRFTVPLQVSENGERQTIIVLANLRSETNYAEHLFRQGMSKDEVLQLIKFSSETEWETSEQAFRALPMSGESPNSVVVTRQTTGDAFGKIGMSRSVARVDIGLNIVDGEPRGLGNTFRMSDVKLYNSSKEGYAAPHSSRIGDDGYVTSPTVPDGAVNGTPLGWSPGAGSPNGILREIYLSEADNNTAGGLTDRTCLVVGGYYTEPGSPEINGDNKTWYRIDFFNPSGSVPSGTLYDILRNHCYTVNISKVSGAGYPTEEEAFNSEPINMETGIITWNDPDIKEVVFDGQYMLGVDRKLIEQHRGEYDDEVIRVYTDYPTGWSAKATDSPSAGGNAIGWITIENPVGEAGYDNISCRIDAPAQGENRTGYVHITAGRLTMVVKVTQDHDEILSIEISPGYEIVFGSTRSDGSHEITLNWSPASCPVTITSTDITAYGAPVDVGGITSYPHVITDGNGEEIFELTLRNEDNGPGTIEDRITRLDFEVCGTNSEKLMRSLYIRKTNCGIVIETASDYGGLYPLLGTRQKLIIKGNTPWQAELVSIGAINSLENNGGDGLVSGEDLWFRMQTGSNSPLYLPGTSVIRFSSPDGSFETFEHTVKAYYGYPFSIAGAEGTQYYVAYPEDAQGTVPEIEGALQKCNSLGNNWMLPSIEPLQNMWNWLGSTEELRRKHGFKDISNSYTSPVYRSSTEGTGSGDSYYYISFDTGTQNHGWYLPNANARCARTIQP